MSCKYDIIDEGGRKRVRALRPFTVQGRDVCPMELGGYVYDANTLSQDGNCWIFSGSLEYPGVRVLDEAIVDMGNNLVTAAEARPKNVIISGNSRIMGAISFETRSFDTAQTPGGFEQGGYTSDTGSVPAKTSNSGLVRTPVPLPAGTVGKVAITSADYEARLISLNEAGLVTSATAWTVGGPTVTLTSAAPYILVVLRKVAGTAIVPADVTAAGVTITRAREAVVTVFNSSIVPVYNGAVALATNILRLSVAGDSPAPISSVNFRNSYIRTECTFNAPNVLRANADFIKVNYNLVFTPGTSHFISGIFRNTNINTPASISGIDRVRWLFDVSDCPNFEYSPVTFPDLAAMYASGKTFYFKQCNMPAGSAIHYYDPKVNVWDNIDFTKAMADLGKRAITNTTLVSSNVQGMYRIRGNVSGNIGMLAQSASSFGVSSVTGLTDTYDSIIYKDCVIKGGFSIIGRNVFGGTLGGASKITNTTKTAMVIDGSFRIEGNAQVTNTPLKGNGYIGGNAELKNGNVEGYIYMSDNAKYIPPVVENPPFIGRLIMSGNAKFLKQKPDGGVLNLEMYDNSVINASISIATAGALIMKDNAKLDRADNVSVITVGGLITMKDNASITGTGVVLALGDTELVGGFNLNSGTRNIYGKHVIASPGDINRPELPPSKTTW